MKKKIITIDRKFHEQLQRNENDFPPFPSARGGIHPLCASSRVHIFFCRIFRATSSTLDAARSVVGLLAVAAQWQFYEKKGQNQIKFEIVMSESDT